MPFWENMPYTNFHGTNQDWIIQQTKHLIEEWAAYGDNLQKAYDTFTASVNAQIADLNGDWNDYKDKMNAAFSDLHDYVYNYFENLDVQDEIDHKLDEMTAQGLWDDILHQFFDRYTAVIDQKVEEQDAKLDDQDKQIDDQTQRIDVMRAEMDAFMQSHGTVSATLRQVVPLWTGSATSATTSDPITLSGLLSDYNIIEVRVTAWGQNSLQTFKPADFFTTAGASFRTTNQADGVLSPATLSAVEVNIKAADHEEGVEVTNDVVTVTFNWWRWRGGIDDEGFQVLGNSGLRLREINGIKYTDISAEKDPELTDIRVGADGIVYPTAGDAVRDQIDQVYDTLNDVYIPSKNIYNHNTDRHLIQIDSSGNISRNAQYKASDYIYIGGGNKVTIQVVSGQQKILFYSTNDPEGYSRQLWITEDQSGYKTYTLASSENYIVITMLETTQNFMVTLGEENIPFSPYGGVPGVFLQNLITTTAEDLKDSSAQKNIINRFNKNNIITDAYLSIAAGGLISSDTFFASDYIYIGDLESITVSYTHIFGWYDINKNWLGHPDNMNSIQGDLTFDRPEKAVYLRFSTYNANLDIAQIGHGVSRSNYIKYGIYSLPDYIGQNNQIIVDASGNGDYTSLTQALYENTNNNLTIVVNPGTYDIVSEYVAIFGQEAVNNMADADSETFNGFQYGAIIRNKKIIFVPGSHVVCDWTGHTVDGTHRFSAIRVDYNCEIEGLDLDSTATFYCVHDDYGSDAPYTVKYKNCKIVGHNLNNANCIGGGCKRYSRHIIENCYFNNNLTDSATVRYHNTNAAGAEPEIYVSNCYFNNWFTPRWYGSQTTKMKVYVNNCEATSIHKMAESASFNTDNVELYKWCNTETNPVT